MFIVHSFQTIHLIAVSDRHKRALALLKAKYQAAINLKVES